MRSPFDAATYHTRQGTRTITSSRCEGAGVRRLLLPSSVFPLPSGTRTIRRSVLSATSLSSLSDNCFNFSFISLSFFAADFHGLIRNVCVCPCESAAKSILAPRTSIVSLVPPIIPPSISASPTTLPRGCSSSPNDTSGPCACAAWDRQACGRMSDGYRRSDQHLSRWSGCA